MTTVHDQQDYNRGQDAGQVHVQNALHLVGTVHDSRLMQFGADAGQRSNIYDGIPSHVLPDARPDVNVGEPLRTVQKEHALATQRNDHLIDDTRGRRHQQEQHTTHDDGRNEVGRISNGLNYLFESRSLDIVQQQCEDDWNRCAHQEIINTDPQGVAYNLLEGIGIKELNEVLKAVLIRPRASDNAQ